MTSEGVAALEADGFMDQPEEPITPESSPDNGGYVKLGDERSAGLGQQPILSTSQTQRKADRLVFRFVKRTFDIVFSLLVVAILALPVLVLCIVIRAESEGSPIYRQQRVGRWGRPLYIYKLRTMVADSDNVSKYLNTEQLKQWLQERKVDNDPRVTRVGAFLRKTSLDELPQFLNVLSSSMSVIGVRPVVEEELAAYGDRLPDFLSVKPGITGWWQVTARNDATYGDGSRQELELYYAKNASLSLDTRIFFGTFKVMLRKTGQ